MTREHSVSDELAALGLTHVKATGSVTTGKHSIFDAAGNHLGNFTAHEACERFLKAVQS